MNNVFLKNTGMISSKVCAVLRSAWERAPAFRVRWHFTETDQLEENVELKRTEKSINYVKLLGRAADTVKRINKENGAIISFHLITDGNSCISETGEETKQSAYHQVIVMSTSVQKVAEEKLVRKGNRLLVRGRLNYFQSKIELGSHARKCSVTAHEIILLSKPWHKNR